MIVGEKIKCSDSVYCQPTKVDRHSVVFEIYKDNQLVNTREYFEQIGLDFEKVRREMKYECKNL